MDVLREEIRETEKTRNDLLKWKLGLVGTLGAAGLGLAGSNNAHHADLVLAAIPPVSLYVDLLCRNLAIKMLVIGTFFRTPEARATKEVEILSAYESHVELARNLDLDGTGLKWFSLKSNAFALEDEALGLSTLALSLGVGAYGVYVAITDYSLGYWVVFVLSAVVGGLGTFAGTWFQYRRRFAAVSRLVPAEASASVAVEQLSREMSS